MQFFGKSDTGIKRRENQDSFVTEQLYENAVLCLVCDGMGGANGGKTASEVTCREFVEQVKKKLPDFYNKKQKAYICEDGDIKKMLQKAVDTANSSVYKKANKNEELSGMGTTLVCALIIDDLLYIAHIGDSRLYFVSDEELKQITRDHSYVQTLIDLGQITPEEASFNPHKNIITRAIGTQKNVEADIICHKLSDIDAEYILLCSDGLTNYADNKTIHSIIKENTSIENACNLLIDKANENGGGDNITAVVIKLDKSNQDLTCDINAKNVDECEKRFENEDCEKRGEF